MQVSIAVPRTVADAQILLDTMQFRVMDEADFHAFAGADDGDLIAEFGDFGVCVLGRETVSFVDCDELEEVLFSHTGGRIDGVYQP